MNFISDFLGAFTRKFRRNRPKLIKYPAEIRIIEVSGSANLTDKEIELFYRPRPPLSNCCPDCYNHEFYAGPTGGYSQNFRCSLCGMGFNLSGGFGDERIGLPYNLWTDQVKAHRRLLQDLLKNHGFQTSNNNWGIEKDGHHGIWIWPHDNFACGPNDLITIHILIWDSNGGWERHVIQLPDPDFIKKIDRALGARGER